jgi:hypothetical protein
MKGSSGTQCGWRPMRRCLYGQGRARILPSTILKHRPDRRFAQSENARPELGTNDRVN